MKRYLTYPDWVEKYRAPGRTIKKTKQGYALYQCTSKYVKGGKPKSIQTYLGKITPEGFIPKNITSEHPVLVEYALSHFILSNFKRDLMRTSYRSTEALLYLGIVHYIFGSCDDIYLRSCFLTYSNYMDLAVYRDSISDTRIHTVSNKISRLMDDYFTVIEKQTISMILLLSTIDISTTLRYPSIPDEVIEIIESNGLHYE